MINIESAISMHPLISVCFAKTTLVSGSSRTILKASVGAGASAGCLLSFVWKERTVRRKPTPG